MYFTYDYKYVYPFDFSVKYSTCVRHMTVNRYSTCVLGTLKYKHKYKCLQNILVHVHVFNYN